MKITKINWKGFSRSAELYFIMHQDEDETNGRQKIKCAKA